LTSIFNFILKKVSILLISSLLLALNSFCQLGGNSTYQFLNLTNSARIAGTGGDFLPLIDDDVSLALSNPSAINKSMDNHIALNFIDYYADIKMGHATYSKTLKKFGSFAASVQFINYGTFTEADVTGQTYGEFKANEQAVTFGWGRQLDSSFFIGANIKSIFSHLDEYKSFGLAVDVAGSYYNKPKLFTATLIFKNIGRQLKAYTPGNIEPLPFEIETGISKKFQHVPLRFDIIYNHLEKFDLTYNDPNDPDSKTDPLTGKVIEKNNINKSMDKLMRHFKFGVEFIPVKYFSLRMGYNYQRRKEMRIDTKVSTIGFSWGFGIKIAKLNLYYSRAKYYFNGSPNYITLSANISDFFSKKTN
jgi:hypothetical protein